MRTSPEYASILGDKRYNDQLTDYSQAAIERRQREARAFLKRFEAIDTTGFPEQEALNQRLMVRDLRDGVDSEVFKDWEMPVNQIGGPHLNAAQLPVLLDFSSTKDYRDYIHRLHLLPVLFGQVIDNMRSGIRDGLMPPKFLLDKVSEQAERLLSGEPSASPFAEPLKHFPASISAADKQVIQTDLLAAIQNDVKPAYVHFRDFVRDEYAPKGRLEPGVWSLPDGAARYTFLVKQSTTTNMTPEEIHQLGLREVARIEAEETAIAQKLGYSDLPKFRAAVNSNPKLRVHSAEEILDLYRKYIDQMYGKLPTLFTRLPKGRLQVVAIEPYREKEASTQYQQGTPDGSRAARVEVNTYEWEKQTTPEIESTAYHEGVPGHHLQIALAQELPALPPFRQQEYYTAYTEGWALYTEGLAKEIGFYQDPYSDFGRLESEMLRAIRLVVDTGLHYKKWTRQQVVDYFHAHINTAEAEVQSETDRYISWPAQALGYKVGALTILRLREKAKADLGDRFDIRLFHDEVVGAGALPMDVLGERIDAWIGRQKTVSRGISNRETQAGPGSRQ
jgi:uncharacterized protein (DUF885 family)